MKRYYYHGNHPRHACSDITHSSVIEPQPFHRFYPTNIPAPGQQAPISMGNGKTPSVGDTLYQRRAGWVAGWLAAGWVMAGSGGSTTGYGGTGSAARGEEEPFSPASYPDSHRERYHFLINSYEPVPSLAKEMYTLPLLPNLLK